MLRAPLLDARRWLSRRCCASSSCNGGSACRIRRWKRRYTTSRCAGSLQTSMVLPLGCPTRSPSFAFVTCSKPTTWQPGCLAVPGDFLLDGLFNVSHQVARRAQARVRGQVVEVLVKLAADKVAAVTRPRDEDSKQRAELGRDDGCYRCQGQAARTPPWQHQPFLPTVAVARCARAAKLPLVTCHRRCGRWRPGCGMRRPGSSA